MLISVTILIEKAKNHDISMIGQFEALRDSLDEGNDVKIGHERFFHSQFNRRMTFRVYSSQ